MGRFRDAVNDKLYVCEDLDQSIDNLLSGFNEFKEKGGTARLVLYPSGGHMCETILTNKTVEEFIKVLLTEYNDKLNEARKEINDLFTKEMRTT